MWDPGYVIYVLQDLVVSSVKWEYCYYLTDLYRLSRIRYIKHLCGDSSKAASIPDPEDMVLCVYPVLEPGTAVSGSYGFFEIAEPSMATQTNKKLDHFRFKNLLKYLWNEY